MSQNKFQLKFTVLNAKLSSSSVFKPDPYVALTVDNSSTSTQKTDYNRSTNNPEWNETFYLSVSPYSQISLKVFNRNSLKKDVLIGEAVLDIFDVLRKNNGTFNKLKLALTLKLPPNNHKSIISNRGPSNLSISLDGLVVDMSQFPEKELSSLEDRQSDTTIAASTITPSTSSLNFDSQPSTSTVYETNNVIAEITSSLPKWSVKDPLSSSAAAAAAAAPVATAANAPTANVPAVAVNPAPTAVNSTAVASVLPPANLPGSSASANEQHPSVSPSRTPSAPMPSTSGTTPPMTNGQPPNR